MLVGEVFGADLQSLADPVGRVALATAVPEGLLLDPAGRTSSTMADPSLNSVQHSGRFGHFVADSVRLATEQIQRCRFDAGGDRHGAPTQLLNALAATVTGAAIALMWLLVAPTCGYHPRL